MRDEEVREVRRDLLDDPDSIMRAALLRRLVPMEFRPYESGAFGTRPPGVKDGDRAWVLEFRAPCEGSHPEVALVLLGDGRVVTTPLSLLRLRKDFLP